MPDPIIWWEDDPNSGIEAFVDEDPSEFRASTWGEVAGLGMSSSLTKEQAPDAQTRVLNDIKILGDSPKNIDEFCFVARQCQQLDVDINPFLQEGEHILYGSTVSTKLKPEYSSSLISEAHLHSIRAFQRAKEGKFEQADVIWDDIYENWLSHLVEHRRPYLLHQILVVSICRQRWDLTFQYLKNMWALTRLSDGHRRHALGIWDEWVSSLIVIWFFMKHVKEFRDRFLLEMKTVADPFGFQRKSLILDHLDNQFIVDAVSLYYYEHAREKMPTLPEENINAVL